MVRDDVALRIANDGEVDPEIYPEVESYVINAPDRRDDDETLLLNVVKNADGRHPETEPDAVSHTTFPDVKVSPVENVVVEVHVGTPVPR
jgi:hypothetical protein